MGMRGPSSIQKKNALDGNARKRYPRADSSEFLAAGPGLRCDETDHS
ncbi:hypothetical protein CA51_31160 [Rosistilla oblonga]|nr:hypothetical protein CA51_31160 [Rosistilla oblonga]